MQHFGDDETNWPLIERYTTIAFCDEAAALRILKMPFLEQDPVSALSRSGDFAILDGLSRLAQSSLDDLEEVLSHPELRGGITDESTALALLLILDREDAAAARAIRALPWIEDGITYTDYDAQPTANFAEDETFHVRGLVRKARRTNKSFWALLDIPWVRDGYSSAEWPIINDLDNMALADDESTARVLGMKFLETLDHDEKRISSLLWDISNNVGLRRLLSSPKLEGGIRDGQFGTVMFAILELNNPDATAALNDLAWIRDGIGPSEEDGVRYLVDAAVKSDSIFRALLTKRWVQDDLTPVELDVVGMLSYWASAPVDGMTGRTDQVTPLRILDMPFLREVTSLDAAAMSTLVATSLDEDTLQQLLSHPELRGGITDDWTNLVAAGVLAARRTGLLDVILDPEQTSVERRVITLPLRGKVALSVIEPRAQEASPFVQPGDALLDPMEVLENTVRTQEEFMGVAFPESEVALLIADVGPERGGHFGYGLIASHSRNAEIIVHETSHIWRVRPTWLSYGRVWIAEGAAEFLTAISERARVGKPLPEPEDSCSLATNISDLVRLELTWDEIYKSACHYILGNGLFLELYDSLGDPVFRQGFRNLHLMSTEDLEAWYQQYERTGRDAGLGYFKATFLSDLTPPQRAIAEEIIARRYFGTRP